MMKFAYLFGSAALAMSAIAGASAASAEELIQAVGGPAAAGKSTVDKSAFAKRDRLVKIDADAITAAFSDARAKSATVRLDLFPGASVTVEATGVSSDDKGLTTIDGGVPGDALSRATIVTGDGMVYGLIETNGKSYEISSAGAGLHRVSELDQSRYPGDLVFKKLLSDKAAEIGVGADVGAAAASDADDRRANTVIDVMLGATYQVTVDYPDWKNRMGLAVADANKSFSNSGALITFRWVAWATFASSYDEKTKTYQQILNDITNAASVQGLRDKYKADLWAMLRSNKNAQGQAFCGLAWYTTTPSAATKNLAYGVVNIECSAGNHSYVHEAGHNMGLKHDRYVQNAFGSDQSSYNYGYSNLTKQVRTVMAYADYCKSKGISSGCTRLGYFSTPFKTYNGGVLGVNTGSLNPAYNTRRLNETRFAISAYR